MWVPTLKETVLNSIVHHLWYNTKLRSLTLTRAYKINSYGSDSHKAQIIESKIDELTTSLCNQIVALKSVPKILKAYIAAALSENAEQINWFIDNAIENMVVVSKVKLQILVKRIKLTPKGFVDTRGCLISTIEDSQFGVNFDKEFLLKYGIGKEELLKIADRIVSSENNKTRKIINQKHIDDINNYPSLKEHFENLCDLDDDTPRHYYGNVMEILIYNSAWDLIPYYFETVNPSDRDTEIEIAADLVFENMVILQAEIFVFLYENMREDAWNEYVVKYFEKAVNAFTDSFRHMHLIVRWFKIALKDDDKTRFLTALSIIISRLKYEKHVRPIVCEIIKNIWMITSKTLTNDSEVRDVVLRQLVTLEAKEFDLLEFVLRTYDNETQKNFLMKTLICTITDAKANSLDDLTRVMKNLGFDIEQMKENVTYDVVKEIIIHDYTIKNKKATDFDKILHLFDKKIETTNFKDLILMETDYVAKILDTFWFEKNLKDFILWLNHNSKPNCEKFMSNLYSNGVIEKVYEKVVMDIGDFDHVKDVELENRFSKIQAMKNGHIGAADEGLENLKLTITEKNTIKKAVLSKPEVQKHILICYFRTESRYDITKEWDLFYSDVESEKKFFTEMLLSEGGKAAILDLVLYCRKMDTVYRYDDQIKYYSTLRKKFFDKYELSPVVDTVLQEHGHPNARRDAILFEGREPKNDEEIFIGKTIVDFKYRTLRAILNSPTPSVRYNKKCVGFFGDLSHELASRIGLNIPEIK